MERMETFEHYQGRTSGLCNIPSYEEYIRDVGSPGLLDN